MRGDLGRRVGILLCDGGLRQGNLFGAGFWWRVNLTGVLLFRRSFCMKLFCLGERVEGVGRGIGHWFRR